MDTEDSIFGDLEDQCTCWVCFELFKEPITLHCAHTFCKECALKVHKKNPSCPFCRRPYDLPLPAVNLEIVSLVAKYTAKLEGKDVPMRTEPVLEQNSFFLQLPREMILEILAFLPPKEIGRSSRICRDVRNLSGDSFIWRTICLREFPFCSVDKYGKNWKHCYVSRANIHKGWEGGKAGDFEVISLRGHQNYVNCFRLYRNNIVSGSADNNLKIWKTDSSDPIHTLVGHNGLINSVEFNEVKIVSSSADSTVKIWDTKLGVPIQTLQHGSVMNAKFDDTKLVAGNNAQVKVWDMRDFSCSMTLAGHWNTVQHVEFDNNYIVSSSQDSVRVWDVRNGNSVNTLQVSPAKIAIGKNNKIVVAQTTGEVGVFDAVNGQYQAFGGARHYQNIHDLKTDGKNVVSACADGTVKLWDLNSNQLVNTLSDHKGPVHTVQLSETKIVSGGADNSMKVWDLKKGNRMYTLLGGSLQQRSNNPNHPTKPGCSHLEIDESRIVASFASLVRIYDFEIYRP